MRTLALIHGCRRILIATRYGSLLMFLISPAAAIAQPQAPPRDHCEAHDCVVFVCDPYRKKTSTKDLFGSALPHFVRTDRRAAPAALADKPSPLGIIRFYGKPGTELDVVLQLNKGRTFMHWPTGQIKPRRLLWDQVTLTDDSSPLRKTRSGHWFESIRDGDALYVSRNRITERGLLYDVELAVNIAIKLESDNPSETGYRIAKGATVKPLDVAVYQPVADGWRVFWLAEAGGGEADQAHTPASGPSPETVPATQPSGTSELSPPNAAPLPMDATPSIVSPDKPIKDPQQVLSSWQPRLAQQGLTEAEIAGLLATLNAHALDNEQVTVVYRLDTAQLDELLPLDITPQPDKIIRVALVIVRHADPAIQNQIKQLITQLGDPNWTKREQATDRLARFGPPAVPLLKKAVKNKDMEIVYRAERLLEQISTGKPSPNSPQQRRLNTVIIEL